MFKNSYFLWLMGFAVSLCIILPNFMVIAQTAANIAICYFSRWHFSTILEWLEMYWNYPRRVHGGLYHCAKSG